MVDHADAADAETGEAGYPWLVERAVAFVQSQPVPVDEDRLIAHVFGNGSAPALWRGLLHTILEGHPTLRRRPDGRWTTGRESTDAQFPNEYVVIDIETTGLKPSQQRILELAVVRIAGDAAPLVWSTLVNPGRAIPAYIADLTGISDIDVATAPAFRSVAPTLVELVADLPIVAHNVAFDLAFINAELSRCGYARLVNQTIDILGLAQAIAPEARRLSLPDVARALGIAAGKPHRALPDARLAHDVFRELLRRACAAGCHSLDDVLRLGGGNRARGRAHAPAGRGRSILDRAHLEKIPNAPGVYIMRDADDRVLYVGKSKDLRKRVASYYSQPLGYTRKLDGLLESLARIDVEVVGSELEALVLESQLIRRYRPRFNTVQRNAEQYVYIRVDVANPWPRVTATKDRADDDAVYFGPFHSAGGVREAVELVNDILPLRTCRRSFTDSRSYGSPCIELSLKRCAGPCVGQADRDQYRGYVLDVLAFFSGDTQRLVDRLHRKLEDTVCALDFERAARLRDQIQRVNRIVLEQVRLNDAARHGHALLVLPGAEPDTREVWYLVRGQRWAALTVDDASPVEDLEARLAPIIRRAAHAFDSVVSNHHSVDEMALIARWLRRTPDHEALIPITAPPCARTLAERVLRVDMTRPFGEVSRDADDAECGDWANESANEEQTVEGARS